MKNLILLTLFAVLFICSATTTFAQQPPANDNKKQAPQFDEWKDDFDGDKLDVAKWEKFTFEGGSGGKLEVKKGEVQIRSVAKTRAGILSKQTFSTDRAIVEAQVAKVGEQLPEPGAEGRQLGFATLTMMFDGSGRNRIEWILTSAGTLEAWAGRDGQIERLDNRKLGTKIKNPVLSIVRRGDEFLFVINDPNGKPEDAQIGLKTTVKNMPKSFRVMLYGFGSSENNWNDVRVVTAK